MWKGAKSRRTHGKVNVWNQRLETRDMAVMGTHREYRPHELRTESSFTDIQQMWGEPSIEVIRPVRHCMNTKRIRVTGAGLTESHRETQSEPCV